MLQYKKKRPRVICLSDGSRIQFKYEVSQEDAKKIHGFITRLLENKRLIPTVPLHPHAHSLEVKKKEM